MKLNRFYSRRVSDMAGQVYSTSTIPETEGRQKHLIAWRSILLRRFPGAWWKSRVLSITIRRSLGCLTYFMPIPKRMLVL